MLRPLVAALIILSTLCSRALAEWLPDGSPVCTYPPCQEGNPVIAPDRAGGVFVVWEDSRSVPTTNYADIYAQHLSASGDLAPGWPIDEFPICTHPSDQGHPAIVADGAGGFFTAWQDFRNNATSYADIYAQHVLADGSLAPGWPVNGVPVSLNPAPEGSVRLAADGVGGVFLVWEIVFGLVLTQHLTAAGVPAPGWSPYGNTVCTQTSGVEMSIIPDSTGGAVVAWRDFRRGGIAPDGFDIYGVRLSPDGTRAAGWSENGSLLVPGQWTPILLPDSAGRFYLVSASPTASATDGNLYVQRFTLDGMPAPGWPAGGVQVWGGPELFSGPVSYDFHAVGDGMGGVLVAWAGCGAGCNEYGARVLPAGTLAPGWPAGGLLVSDPSQPYVYDASIAPDGIGGAYFAWQVDYPSFVQHIAPGGSIASGWRQYGVRLASTCAQFTPQLVPDAAGGAIAVWEERDGTCSRLGLFAQRFVPDGPVPVLVSLVSADAQPDRVSLTWQGPGAGSLVAAVYRRSATGEWTRLGAPTADGADRLRYEDRDVTPGERYAYRLGYGAGATEQFSAESWVEVPAAVRLALAGFQPNPAPGGALRVGFALPGAEPATLELLDVSGRRIVTREVGTLGAGNHVLRLDDATGLNPGVYWVRLAQAGRRLLAKGIVSR
ncbi:MAG: hypothetical protein HZC42_04535 [Candidatus Eisenbacteria bacterium]|nr:hypothetical protein [Candidatus Eisenbacteria bacterium]